MTTITTKAIISIKSTLLGKSEGVSGKYVMNILYSCIAFIVFIISENFLLKYQLSIHRL